MPSRPDVGRLSFVQLLLDLELLWDQLYLYYVCSRVVFVGDSIPRGELCCFVAAFVSFVALCILIRSRSLDV